MQYEIVMFWDEGEQLWGVQVPDLPGCSAQGASVAQAESNASIAIRRYIADLRAKRQAVPRPTGHLLRTVDAAPEIDAGALRPDLSESTGRLHVSPAQRATRAVTAEQLVLEGFSLPDPLPLTLSAEHAIDTVA